MVGVGDHGGFYDFWPFGCVSFPTEGVPFRGAWSGVNRPVLPGFIRGRAHYGIGDGHRARLLWIKLSNAIRLRVPDTSLF